MNRNCYKTEIRHHKQRLNSHRQKKSLHRSKIHTKNRSTISTQATHQRHIISIKPPNKQQKKNNIIFSSQRFVGIVPKHKRSNTGNQTNDISPRPIYQERNVKTAIIGAGVAGITTARLAQVMGYMSPLTLIDMVPPARITSQNKKRNHPLLISSSTLDALGALDIHLYRRLLSLGRFDTQAGYLDWNDKPTKLLMPKINDDVLFPRWVNHLCLPRDAYAFAAFTTPLIDIPETIKHKLRTTEQETVRNIISNLPRIALQIGRVAKVDGYHQEFVPISPNNPHMTVPTSDAIPIVKVYPSKTSGPLSSTSLIKDSQTAKTRSLDFNTVIAADGLASDIWRHRHGADSPIERLTFASNNNDIKIHGWVQTSALHRLIGENIDGVPFRTYEEAFSRVNSRIWTRRENGLRFKTILMDYPPLHLSSGVHYQPKNPSDESEWIYWELLVAKQVWQKYTSWKLPIGPAVNNWLPSILAPQYNESELALQELVDDIDLRGIDEPVCMIPNAKDISGEKIVNSIPLLNRHPLIRILMSETQSSALTIESSGYNPVKKLSQNGSVFDDGILYVGESAYSITNDTFLSDTLTLDQGIIAGLSIASNLMTGPEVFSRRLSVLMDNSLRQRAEFLQRRTSEHSTLYGEPSSFYNKISQHVENYFPARDSVTDYEQLYRFNPLQMFETRSSEQIAKILARNNQYRENLQQGFLDGKTQKIDFGDIPLDSMDVSKLPIRPSAGVGMV